MILAFTLLYGLVLCCALWVGGSLWQLYLFFTILGIAMASGPAPVPYGVVISHWFNRHRGLALGLSMMGIGIGSVVVPILAQRLITIFGWRTAFAIFGGAVLLLPLPIIAAFLQNDPEQRGLHPDGDENNQLSHLPPQEKQGLSWREIWHSPTFWVLICIFSLTGASVHGAVLHHVRDIYRQRCHRRACRHGNVACRRRRNYRSAWLRLSARPTSLPLVLPFSFTAQRPWALQCCAWELMETSRSLPPSLSGSAWEQR